MPVVRLSPTYDRGRTDGAACGRTPFRERPATMNDMTSDQPIRASDAERDESAQRIQSATAEGRLTFEEAGERLDAVLASRFRHELSNLVADLPSPRAPADSAMPVSNGGPDPGDERARGPGSRGRGHAHSDPTGRWALGIHAAVVAVISMIMVARWAISGVPYFWPMFPMFWLLLSLVVHSRRRASHRK